MNNDNKSPFSVNADALIKDSRKIDSSSPFSVDISSLLNEKQKTLPCTTSEQIDSSSSIEDIIKEKIAHVENSCQYQAKIISNENDKLLAIQKMRGKLSPKKTKKM